MKKLILIPLILISCFFSFSVGAAGEGSTGEKALLSSNDVDFNTPFSDEFSDATQSPLANKNEEAGFLADASEVNEMGKGEFMLTEVDDSKGADGLVMGALEDKGEMGDTQGMLAMND